MTNPQPVNVPLWHNAGLIKTGPLAHDTRCSVCIVGAGIAGLLTAERLLSEGLDVVVLDSYGIGSGETGRTTAHITSALDDRYSTLRRLHGEEGARLAAQSHSAAVSHICALAHHLDLRCNLQTLDGYLVVNDDHAAARESLLADEFAAASEAGLPVDRVPDLPAPWPLFGPALRFRNQAQFHPLEFLRGLARHLIVHRVRIFTDTRAIRIEGGNDPCVHTESGTVVRCAHVVVATNTPVNNLVAVHTRQSGYQTYVLALEIPRGSLPPLLLWDGLWNEDKSYHYIRVLQSPASSGPDLLIVGGEDHKTGQGPDGDAPYQRLEHWARAHFPLCGRIARHWSGEVMEPADALASIGPNPTGPRNISIITGDSGNGMTHAAIAALLLGDQINRRENPWSRLYDPGRRLPLHATGNYLRENLNTALQYRDWLRPGEARDDSAIAPGQGAVIRRGLKQVAVYKHPDGHCSCLDATCTHLGGIVHWNSQEETWDCPCHASRFDRHGRVLHGPAIHDLKQIADGESQDARETRETPHAAAQPT